MIAVLAATDRNLPTELLSAVSGPFPRQPATADSHRRPFASIQQPSDGIVMTDGKTRFDPEGNPDATRPVPGRMRDGSWGRGRNIPHVGRWPTARARGYRPPCAGAAVTRMSPIPRSQQLEKGGRRWQKQFVLSVNHLNAATEHQLVHTNRHQLATFDVKVRDCPY